MATFALVPSNVPYFMHMTCVSGHIFMSYILWMKTCLMTFSLDGNYGLCM